MNEKALQVLLVEDNAGDARLLREMFHKEEARGFELTHLLRMSEALDHLAKGAVDIVLLDLGLPDGHGVDTVRRMHAAAPGVPLIVLTGLDDETFAVQAMKEGAQDYLIKGQIESRALPRALRHAIERHRMHTEADVLRTNQMQFKDEFLSHVSHELRSPLNAIYQFVTILLDRLAGELKSEQQKYLRIVLRNVKQLQAMIDDLIEVTHVQAGKLTIELQCVEVSDALGYAVNTLQEAAATKSITLSAQAEEHLPSICADPMRLRQILIILVDNAIKFTPKNGTVTVRARKRDEFPNVLVLEVSDSGCGIDPDMTERIFERLYQASDPALDGRKGLGLGLYICKELVTRQGGQIWATSKQGQGSVFSVTLPVFSLPSLIAPAFKKPTSLHGAVTLVIAELASRAGWISNEMRAQHAYEFRELLQQCLHSDLDVLLPRMGLTGATELFFIMAVTDAIGGEAIAQRARERLEICTYLQNAGLTLTTTHRSVATVERHAGESMEDLLGDMATNIQELMNEEISSRQVRNER